MLPSCPSVADVAKLNTLPHSRQGISLSGSVNGLTPEEALAAVLPTCGLVHRVDAGDLYLSPGF